MLVYLAGRNPPTPRLSLTYFFRYSMIIGNAQTRQITPNMTKCEMQVDIGCPGEPHRRDCDTVDRQREPADSYQEVGVDSMELQDRSPYQNLNAMTREPPLPPDHYARLTTKTKPVVVAS